MSLSSSSGKKIADPTFRSTYVTENRKKQDFQTDCREWLTWLDETKSPDRTHFFRVRCTSFHIHSPLLTFFLCFIVLFQSCCSHAQVFGKTLVHEFPILYSHTEWNLLSSGTNTLLWWRACWTKLNYKQTNKENTINPCICGTAGIFGH